MRLHIKREHVTGADRTRPITMCPTAMALNEARHLPNDREWEVGASRAWDRKTSLKLSEALADQIHNWSAGGEFRPGVYSYKEVV